MGVPKFSFLGVDIGEFYPSSSALRII